jgi:micrococcal nuclease
MKTKNIFTFAIATLLVAFAMWNRTSPSQVQSSSDPQQQISVPSSSEPKHTQSQPTRSHTYAQIMYCSDGDTCHVKAAGGELWFNVRLFGIDAPETAKKRRHKSGQPMGEAAKNYLNELIKGREVEIIQADLDPYNRPVVEIYLNGECVNLKMVALGYAETYKGKTKRLDRQKYETAEAAAKEKKLGVWTQDNYQSPKEFRMMQKR